MKYCKKCGTQMKDESEFCPKCGASQTAGKQIKLTTEDANIDIVNNKRTATMTNNISTSDISTKPKNSLLGVGIAVVLLAALCGGGYYYYTTQGANSSVIVQQEDSKNDSSSAENKKSEYDNIQKEINEKGIAGTVLASTKGHVESGYLSLIKNGNEYNIVTTDLKNNRIAVSPYSNKIFHYTDKKPKAGDEEVVIFNINVLNDGHDKDEGSGAWDGQNHILSVYAFYKFDESGNVIPGMLCTGTGLKPSHYHGYFNETRNVDTINLFLTEMVQLQKIVKEKDIEKDISAKGVGFIAGTEVILREAADKKSKALDTFSNNEKVVILGTSGDWVNVERSNGEKGWVFSKYCAY